ncbi:hypothetical protein ABVK25_007718 [Lepraria finkii]|uniref:Uncharacterized protein n=1 Tax=Lepraria finkii TaxID=1340010 RepID=A0ABR4B4S8_9LECA
MQFSRLAFLAAALNLALGSPILERKSRSIVASDAAKRALVGTETEAATLDSRNAAAAAYQYRDTPRYKRSVEDLSERSAAAQAYKYGDTPRYKRSVEDLSGRSAAAQAYEYRDTPRYRRSLEDLSKGDEAESQK